MLSLKKRERQRQRQTERGRLLLTLHQVILEILNYLKLTWVIEECGAHFC